MNDPLAHYGEYMTTRDVAELLGITYGTAREIVMRMPYTNVGFGKSKECRRVQKEEMRKFLKLPSPLRVMDGGRIP